MVEDFESMADRKRSGIREIKITNFLVYNFVWIFYIINVNNVVHKIHTRLV